MALTCTHLTLDTPSPTLPFAPKSAPRGRGTERMLQDTTLAPTGLAPNGGPRTRILSKITGTLGARGGGRARSLYATPPSPPPPPPPGF